MNLPGSLYLIDTSAAARAATQPQVRTLIEDLVNNGVAATCVTVDLEVGYSVREPARVASVHKARAVSLTVLPLTLAAANRARDVQALMAERGLHRAAGAMDLLTAAVAELHGATVLHYDADFEHIAKVTGQAQQWIMPRGSVS